MTTTTTTITAILEITRFPFQGGDSLKWNNFGSSASFGSCCPFFLLACRRCCWVSFLGLQPVLSSFCFGIFGKDIDATCNTLWILSADSLREHIPHSTEPAPHWEKCILGAGEEDSHWQLEWPTASPMVRLALFSMFFNYCLLVIVKKQKYQLDQLMAE